MRKPPVQPDTDRDQIDEVSGVVAALGDLKSGAVIMEEGIATLFQRHPASVKRAVERGELPPPFRLFGQNAWTVGVLVRHLETRLQLAAEETGKWEQKLSQLQP